MKAVAVVVALVASAATAGCTQDATHEAKPCGGSAELVVWLHINETFHDSIDWRAGTVRIDHDDETLVEGAPDEDGCIAFRLNHGEFWLDATVPWPDDPYCWYTGGQGVDVPGDSEVDLELFAVCA